MARLTQQTCGPSCSCTACSDVQEDQEETEEPQYDEEDYETEEYDDSDPEEGQEDEVNIDDGLLDDVFEDEVAPRNNNSNNKKESKAGGGGGCSSCETMVVCVMGGSNSQVSQPSPALLLLSDLCRAPCLRWPQWRPAVRPAGPRGLSTSPPSPRP